MLIEDIEIRIVEDIVCILNVCDNWQRNSGDWIYLFLYPCIYELPHLSQCSSKAFLKLTGFDKPSGLVWYFIDISINKIK